MLIQQQLDDTLYKANTLTNEYKTVVSDLDSQTRIVADFQAYKGRMEVDYENLKSDLQSTQRKSDMHRAESAELQVEIERLMNENNNLREERDNLIGQLNDLGGLVEEKNRNIDGLRHDVEEIQRLKEKTRYHEDLAGKLEYEKNREINDLKS